MVDALPGTVVGLKTSEGVVLASEKRLTYDGFILSRNARKIHMVTSRVGVGFAGLMGDVNFLVRLLKLEAKNYELQHGREIKARSLAKLLSVILYSYKLIPMLTEVVVGGYDNDTPSIYILDPVGSLIEEKYAALGSGAQLALGYIEPRYKPDLTLSEAEELAVNAIKAVIERDVLSGDGVDIAIISREGYKFKEILFKVASQ
ncbi:MAG: proteasome subunit beta [Desulfurococcus sp.]|nr:proteasome subunit beta [Desulfurococcus sp.]